MAERDLKVNPRVLRREQSLRRAMYCFFLCLVPHLAQKGHTVQGAANREPTQGLSTAISSVPTKNYRDQNATLRRPNGPHLAAQTQ